MDSCYTGLCKKADVVALCPKKGQRFVAMAVLRLVLNLNGHAMLEGGNTDGAKANGTG